MVIRVAINTLLFGTSTNMNNRLNVRISRQQVPMNNETLQTTSTHPQRNTPCNRHDRVVSDQEELHYKYASLAVY